jgi:hypothetical protein
LKCSPKHTEKLAEERDKWVEPVGPESVNKRTSRRSDAPIHLRAALARLQQRKDRPEKRFPKYAPTETMDVL